MLRTLLEIFAYKAASIGEVKNFETMKLKELIGSLRTFEMELKEERHRGGEQWPFRLNHNKLRKKKEMIL